jgi:hypothetical protein
VALVRERTITTSYRCMSAKLVPTFAARGCRVVSATDPYDRTLGFLDRTHYRYYLFSLIKLKMGFYPVAVVLQ